MSAQHLFRRLYALSVGVARGSESDRSLPGYFDACHKLSRARSREDVALFRRHFASGINSASPIVAALVRDGLDLNYTMNSIDPPPLRAMRSPWWSSTSPIQSKYEPSRDEPFRAFRQRHRLLGTVIRSPDHRLGRLGIRSRLGCIDVEIGIGDHVLWTRGGTANLMIDAAIPMTTAIALPGRSLGQLCSHPLLLDAYPITDVVQDPQGWTVVCFSTGTLPCNAEVREGKLAVFLHTSAP